MVNCKCKIIINSGINVLPHELKTAEALRDEGFTVEFVKKSEADYVTTADVLIDGLFWEMKSPKSSKLNAVERNLRRAAHQSCNIIFDSRRMKGLPDNAIERELRKYSLEIKSIRRVLFVNRERNVIEIPAVK